MLAALLLGMSYGFTAGISPGPLLGLVISQTLQRGWRAGNMVALAPLCSDFPIVVLALLVISRLPHVALGWLGIIGGLFVMYLGIETIRDAWKHVEIVQKADSKHTSSVLLRATLINVLNPHPYLFWSTVGAPSLIRINASGGISAALAFLAAFYALLVGAKLFIAFVVSRSRNWLQGRTYQRILIVSGVLLLGLGVLLIIEGVQVF